MNLDLNQLVKWRREFHRFPEIGWSEFWTTSRIADYLEDLDCFEIFLGKQIINPDFVRGRKQAVVDKGLANAKAYGANEKWLEKMEGYTGCVALFDSGKPGKTIALRFDIDCVNVTETRSPEHIPNKEGFASINDGFMHACGHDSHITIGLGVALWIAQNKDKLTGKVKIVFQPAEEGVRGAAAIAQSGIIDDADYFASSHISFCANTVTQLHGIARHGEGMTRINVGVLKAGEGRNVIPSSAELQLEVRGENKAINEYMTEQVMQIAKGISISFDVAYETEIVGEAVDMNNDVELIKLIEEISLEQPQINNVNSDYAFNASEDATILGRRVQEHGGKAIYFILGADRTAGHHEAEFDFDENQLLTGVNIYTSLVQKLLA